MTAVQIDRIGLQGTLAVPRVAVGGQDTGGSVELLVVARVAPIGRRTDAHEGGQD